MKSKNFTVIVSQMSARAKKLGGGAPNTPPTLYRVNPEYSKDTGEQG